MNVLYVINGLGFSKNTGIGGSDKRAVEIIRNIKTINPESNPSILTTDSGHNIFLKTEKLDINYIVLKKPLWWPKFVNKYIFGRVLSYFYATFASFLKVRVVRGYDAYFATSDYFFDVLPCYLYKLVHKKKMICMIHHHIVSPKARGGSKIINVCIYLSQRFSFWLISKTADAVFLYDTDEGRKIKRLLFKNKSLNNSKVYFVKNGINKDAIDNAKDQEKIYEACFLGGLRCSKGIDEFVPIWKTVVEKYPKAKFLVVGGGSAEIIETLQKDINKHNLQNNILLTGPLSGKKLFKNMKSSRLFLFPSHEEGWGIALCEAMYCGLPVICYDLPAFKTFGDVLDKFEVGNYEKLALKIIDYLKNPEKIKNKEDKLKNVAEKYTWDKIAQEEIEIYKEVI